MGRNKTSVREFEKADELEVLTESTILMKEES